MIKMIKMFTDNKKPVLLTSIWVLYYVDDLAISDTDCFDALKHTVTHCNTLQHTATHCNTIQHTATHDDDFAISGTDFFDARTH